MNETELVYVAGKPYFLFRVKVAALAVADFKVTAKMGMGIFQFFPIGLN